MVAARARGLRPGGVVRAVVRLALLVGVGFAAGLLIGVVTEEPELLAGHLRGEGESVPLVGELSDIQEEVDGDPEADRNEVVGDGLEAGGAALAAAESPTKQSEARLHPASTPQAQTTGVQADRVALLAVPPEDSAPRLPVVAAALETSVASPARKIDRSGASESSPSWAIQVGAFSEQSAAARLAAGLSEKGYAVELIPATSETHRWRVRVQPVDGETRARELAERLKREERLPTWVTRMEARSGS